MFEKAARMKLRFPFRGQASVEDLWDLTVFQLDEIYKNLNGQLKAQDGNSLLDEKDDTGNVLQLQVDIVKHIVSVKLAEREAAEKRAERKARKQQILGIIKEKQNAALYDMPLEELKALVSDD